MFPTPEEDIRLETIDFEWIEKCTSVKNLRKAYKILKEDGGYYTELENAITKRIEELNPEANKTKPYQNVDPETKRLIQQGLYEWETEANEKEARKKNAANRQQGLFEPTTEQGEVMDEERRKRIAENEKAKGNEAITSGDIKEALKCYTKSIQHYDKIAATFCNRALAYLKLKDYKSCVNDCNKAIELQSDYSKAFHRRAKANFAMGNYSQAVEDFQKVMVLEPKNAEVNGELMEARKKLSDSGKSIPTNSSSSTTTANKQGEFKRVAIQEDSESDEEEEQAKTVKNGSQAAGNKGSESTSKLSQMIDDMLIEEQGKNVGEKLKRIDDFKARANDLLKTGMFELATVEYEKGLVVVNDIITSGAAKSGEHSIPDIKATLLNNIAYCNMQMDMSEKVVTYASLVIGIEDIQTNTLIKAHLRRALAYEKLDKIAASLRDFEIVKTMDPGNVQASQGLSRLHKLISRDDDLKKSVEKARSQEITKEKESKQNKEEINRTHSSPAQPEVKKTEEAKSSDNTEFSQLEELKTKGNNFFKDKNFDAANKTFREARIKIEESLKKESSAEEKAKLEKLYVQVLSNAAMSCFNVNDIEQSLLNCEKALKVEPTHTKCLYRKALCQMKLGDKADKEKGGEEIDRKKKQLALYEDARKILEDLLHQDKQNKDIKDKLSDLVGLIVPIRRKYNLTESKPENKKIEVQAETTHEADTETTPQPAKKKAPKPDTYKLSEGYIDNVVKTVTDDLITKDDIPTTSNRFEINCQSFKKSVDRLYFYVKKIPVQNLVELYKEKTIPTDLLLNIVSSVKASGLTDDPEYSLKLLQAIPQTYKFSIALSQTVKKEKTEISGVLQKLHEVVQNKNEVDALYDVYKCRGL